MVLSSGTRLGNYEIQDAVGAGGMGEVYRARDTMLDRDVALKVLPHAFVLDADRLARFKREAQVLALLNHTNIAGIYGFQETDGVQALVLEFVDGPTLGERIAHGPIAIDEALAIALQIADALEAAHEQGIIHRDLKPSNIKLRPDGTVKVLDFGLAKALAHDHGQSEAGQYRRRATDPVERSVRHDPEVTASPTVTTPAMPFDYRSGHPEQSRGVTQMGVILGTAAYMSPEQAKGRPADKRGDIWAFGCVLYEMLTGARAFDADDIAETMAAVIRATPDWSRLPSGTPQSVRRLLRRCLEKDRKERLPHVGAARLELKEALAGLDVEMPAVVTTVATASPVVRSRRGARLMSLVAAVLVTALVMGAVAWVLRPRPAPPPQIVRFTFTLGEEDQFTGTPRQMVAISPDGTQIVYTANNRLYRRPIDGLVSQEIPGTEVERGAPSGPVFSPDGLSIAFHSLTASGGEIDRIPLSGGSRTTIAQVTANPLGISWDERGIVFAGGRGGIFRVSPNGGSPEPLVRLDAGQMALGPQLLPGGDAVLFTLADFNAVNPASRWDTAKIVVHSLSSGERTEVVDGGSGARYLPSGHLVYAVSGSLFAQAFNPATRRTSGDRIRILSGVRRTSTAISGAAQFSVSNTGSLVYVPGSTNATSALRSLIISDQSGTKTTLKLPPGSYTHPRVSPDGTRLAVAIDDGQEADISIYDLAETTSIRRLTLEGHNRYPVWSGDGQRVAFQSDRLGDLGIFWQRADGGGIAERLTTAAQDVAHTPESFSRDGKYLLFTEYRDQTYSLHILSMNDKSIAPFGKVTSTEPTGAEFSPDGRWVAYASTAGASDTFSSNRGIFIQPFPATGAPIQVPKVRVDYHPAWAPDGHSLLFVATAPQPFAAVGIRTEPGVTFEPARELPQSVPRPLLLSGDVRGYDIMPDGRLISLNPAVDQDSTGAAGRPEIRVVINWFEELKRLVPTN